jgi:hypothetical protein
MELMKKEVYLIRHKPSGTYARPSLGLEWFDPEDILDADKYATHEDAEEARTTISKKHLQRGDTERIGLDALEIVALQITVEEIS